MHDKPVDNHVQTGQLNHVQAGQLNHDKPVNNHVQTGQLNHVQACQQAVCAFLCVQIKSIRFCLFTRDMNES